MLKWILLGGAALAASCNERSGAPPQRTSDNGPAPAVSETAANVGESAATRAELPALPEDDSNRWLRVTAVKKGADGGWASGSFDATRNKLDIHTRDVERFAVELGLVKVDWRRVVILSIDGKNSELRRRDQSLLHFALDDHGQWIVAEP